MGAIFSAKTPLAIKRGNRRRPVAAPAILLTGSGQMKAKLANVSRTGALAEAMRPPVRGSSVVVAFRGCTIPALVAWVAGCRFGLEFEQLLSEEQLAGFGSARLF